MVCRTSLRLRQLIVPRIDGCQESASTTKEWGVSKCICGMRLFVLTHVLKWPWLAQCVHCVLSSLPRYVYDKLPSVLLEHRTAACQQVQRSLAQFSQGGATSDAAAAAADGEAAGAVGKEAVGGLVDGDIDEQVGGPSAQGC